MLFNNTIIVPEHETVAGSGTPELVVARSRALEIERERMQAGRVSVSHKE